MMRDPLPSDDALAASVNDQGTSRPAKSEQIEQANSRSAPVSEVARVEWALALAEQGFAVLPVWWPDPDSPTGCACGKPDCDRPAKHPIPSQGVKQATKEPTRIKSWYAEHPEANVAMATGAISGVICIDVDTGGDKEGDVSITVACAGHGGVPRTLTARSGSGGRHYFYKFRTNPFTRKIGFLKHVDYLGDSGYVIVAPSRNLKGAYAWDAGTDIADLRAQMAELPEWFDKLVGTDKKPKTKKPGGDGSGKKDFDPQRLQDIARLRDALRAIDPDSRDLWVKFGIILGRAFNGSDDGWQLYEEWAARSPKYTDKGTAERMHTLYHKESRNPPQGGEPATVASIFAEAIDAGWQPAAAEPAARDGDHLALANATLDALAEAAGGSPPVYAAGALQCYSPEDGLWHAQSVDQVGMTVARLFAGGKLCRRGSDFAAIAKVVVLLCEDETFFDSAPVGIAAPGGFWRVTAAGDIVHEPLTAAHRQRFRVAADPDLEAEPALLLRMLGEAFAGHSPEDQIQLAQQLTGAALTQSLWQHRLVAMLVGVTSSGKSTFLQLLRAAFPPEVVAATSPERWGDPYYVAALAGKALNLVGELDKTKLIPGGAFKSLTGRDLVEGRHPTHRPFSFTCRAAHFFNGNRVPLTTDHSDAFFERWRVLHFANAKPKDQRERDLPEQILRTELGALLGWALRGAADVVRAGGIRETAQHRSTVERWRVERNSALAFVCDSDACWRGEADLETKGQDLFKAYQDWASDTGVQAFGRAGFYEALQDGGGAVGVRVVTRENQKYVQGVKQKQRPF